MQQRSARSAAVRQWVLQDRQVLAETTPSQNGKVSSSQPASLIMPTASPRRKRQPASSPRAARPTQRPTSRQPLPPTASSQPAYPIMQASSPRMGRPPQQPQTRQPSPDVDQQRMPPQQSQTRQPSPDVDQQRMPPQQPQTRQAPPDMDELRRLAYQQRQQQRRKRVITPKMLKARPIEIKQNVVMRSKHKGSAGSVTSEISHRSDITEKVTNSKERLRRNSNEIERLETLQSMETFESLMEEAENKMAMANTLLAEATEAKRQAQLEIAEEREHLKAAEDAREAALAEAQRQSKIAQDEEKRRQEVEQARLLLEEQLKIAADGERQAKMAEAEQRRLLREEENRRKLEDAEKRKAQERAEERIRMLEAEKMRLDHYVSRTFRELAAEQGNDFLAMDNEALRLLDLACLQAEERAEDTMNEIQSVTSLIEQERHEMEHVNGVVSVGSEEVKEVMDDSGNAEGEVNEEKSKKSRNLFKSLRGGKKSDKAKKGNEADTEQMSVSCSVSRVKELELELLEQSEQIAQKKKEVYNLVTELKSNSSVNQAIQRGPGKASEEKDRMKTSFFPDKISQDTVEEAIEVMPTLSEVDFISVNTPLSIDESAFAHKPNLLQRTGSLIKRNPLSRNESFTKMSKEEKRAFRHGKAMAKVDNRFQEIVEVKSGCDGGDEDGEKPKEASQNICGGKDDNKMISNDWLNENATFVSENGASFIDSNDPTYDEDVAILVANTSDSTAYEEENVDEFVVSSSSASQAQFNPPEKFIQIPTKRVPVQRVRSKEIAVQTDGYPMTTPPMMSPRPTNPQLMSPGAMSPRPTNTQKESFFETAALIGSTACMGGSRAILACADTCNESNPDSRVHDAYNRSSSYPGSPTASSVNYYDPDSSLASSVNYYNPTSPAASSMFRSGSAAYSKDEEDLVTRAFVNALQRVDSALHLAEEKKALEEEEEEDSELEYSARRKPRRHSKRQVKFDDIMSVDGRYVSAREQAKRRQERVPRNLALKPRMQTPRGSDQVWREELGSPREQWRDELGSPREQWREEISSPREKKKGLGKKMFNGIKKLTKVRIVYDD